MCYQNNISNDLEWSGYPIWYIKAKTETQILEGYLLGAFLCLQFRRKGPNEDGLIQEADFAELLLAYGGYPPNKKARMLKRVKKAFKVTWF